MDNVFCENLKSARIKKGMTQEQVASAVGVAVTTYSSTGQKNNPRHRLLADAEGIKKPRKT